MGPRGPVSLEGQHEVLHAVQPHAPRARAMALRSSTAQHPFRAAPRFQRRAAARCGKKGAKKRPPAEAKAGPSVRPPEAGSTLDVVKPYELEPAYKPSVRAAED